jgi:hypothetical protein
MNLHVFRFAAAALSLAFISSTTSAAEPRISGPYSHDNLSIYLIHGPSAPGPVPMTLGEALAKGAVRVHETGDVNELSIENLGSEEIFVQSGDIVKGGQQDRVVMSSLVLTPKSGLVPLAAFCVEQGRWSARGDEDVSAFSSSIAALPSKEAKLAIKAPSSSSRFIALGGSETSARQQMVWESVANIQAELSERLGAAVASEKSASSLQLALENEKLDEERGRMVKALQDVALVEDDVVGFAFAINGELNSADLYPSNGLFRKMWAKSLAAAATEAIGKRGTAAAKPAAPGPAMVATFLATAEAGKAEVSKLSERIALETRDSDKAYQFETRRADGGFIHRNVLAK